MGYQAPDKIGWSAAPVVNDGVASQKLVCDELIARIQAGENDESYGAWFGRFNAMSLFIEALGKASERARQVKELQEKRVRLSESILRFQRLYYKEESIVLLDNQRLKDLQKIKAEIIHNFVDFYAYVLEFGVDLGLFSMRLRGEFHQSKEERGMGVPFL